MVPQLSESELRVLQAAWLCFKTIPEVDYNKLAEVCGYKNKATAASCFSTAKNKLLGSGKVAKGKKSAKPLKRAAPVGVEPKKRGKKAKVEMEAVENEETGGKDDGESGVEDDVESGVEDDVESGVEDDVESGVEVKVEEKKTKKSRPPASTSENDDDNNGQI